MAGRPQYCFRPSLLFRRAAWPANIQPLHDQTGGFARQTSVASLRLLHMEEGPRLGPISATPCGSTGPFLSGAASESLDLELPKEWSKQTHARKKHNGRADTRHRCSAYSHASQFQTSVRVNTPSPAHGNSIACISQLTSQRKSRIQNTYLHTYTNTDRLKSLTQVHGLGRKRPRIYSDDCLAGVGRVCILIAEG